MDALPTRGRRVLAASRTFLRISGSGSEASTSRRMTSDS